MTSKNKMRQLTKKNALNLISKNKYTVQIMPKNKSPFRCKFEWDKVNDL